MTDSLPNPVFSHLDATGNVRMVDVADKPPTRRAAAASATVRMGARAYALLRGNPKGEVFNTARIAGILAAKRCAELIPLCHSLPLSFVGVEFTTDDDAHSITVYVTCRSEGKTGVEMEAMTACSMAALTIYDMCKAADKSMVIEAIQLHAKSGGKSGAWQRP